MNTQIGSNEVRFRQVSQVFFKTNQWLIDWLIGVKQQLQQYFNYIVGRQINLFPDIIDFVNFFYKLLAFKYIFHIHIRGTKSWLSYYSRTVLWYYYVVISVLLFVQGKPYCCMGTNNKTNTKWSCSFFNELLTWIFLWFSSDFVVTCQLKSRHTKILNISDNHMVQQNLSIPNVLGINFCVRNRQRFPTLGLYF